MINGKNTRFKRRLVRPFCSVTSCRNLLSRFFTDTYGCLRLLTFKHKNTEKTVSWDFRCTVRFDVFSTY